MQANRGVAKLLPGGLKLVTKETKNSYNHQQIR